MTESYKRSTALLELAFFVGHHRAEIVLLRVSPAQLHGSEYNSSACQSVNNPELASSGTQSNSQILHEDAELLQRHP